MKYPIREIYWIYFLVVWFMNVYDLIVGNHFYQTTTPVIVLNLFAAMALYLIFVDKKESSKGGKK